MLVKGASMALHDAPNTCQCCWSTSLPAAIDRRIANVSMTPVYHGEGLQVLRYEVGQKYEAHWDYFFDEKNAAKGANRYATMLTFLDTVEEGGETVFTKMPTPNGRDNKGFSECAKHHLAVKPHKVRALGGVEVICLKAKDFLCSHSRMRGLLARMLV
uniref:Prolyl 4-hydroxylase alpha subunit Fe(2+) 2OG dioxygenase domain-containing protein n=1 Tax=Dunaliella tertiolecta TaxID=3047 RepID=A0A7S3VQ84_DUNTE